MRSIFNILTLLLFLNPTVSKSAGEPTDRITNIREARARKSAAMEKIFSDSRKQRLSSTPPFYIEEFAGGIPSSWRNIDSANSGRRWRFSNNACGMCDAFYIGTGVDSLSVAGTSSANGIAMYDSDSSQASIGGDYGVLITPAINCTGRTSVQLSFNELFVYCNDLTNPAYQNTARVYVSNNNVNWTLVHAADAGLSICGDATDNPTQVSIDITGIAANQPTVYIRFTYTGDYGYWWFLDDVALTQPFPYEAEMVSIEPIFNGCSLSNNEAVSITLRNNGSQTISNFPVSYSINGNAPVVETIPNPIPSNTLLTYTFNQRANLASTGAYTIIASVNLTNDALTTNDRDTLVTYSTQPNSNYPYVNGFESASDFGLCTLLDWDGDGASPQQSSQNSHTGNKCLRFPATASGTTYDKWMVLPCMNLTAGQDYLLGFWTSYSSLAGSGTLRAYLAAGTDPADTVSLLQNCILPPSTFYSQQNCTFVPPQSGSFHIAFRYSGYNIQPTLDIDDINLDLTVGIDEENDTRSFHVAPNPSNGNIRIEFAGSNLKQSTLTVRDILGKTVLTMSSADEQLLDLDLSECEPGVYFISLSSGNNETFRRIIISR